MSNAGQGFFQENERIKQLQLMRQALSLNRTAVHEQTVCGASTAADTDM